MPFYTITGTLKPGAEAKIAGLQDAFNEHLAQPYRHIRLAGALHDRDGRRAGYMVIIEADSFELAEAYLHESPIFQAALYEHAEVARYQLEVGRLT